MINKTKLAFIAAVALSSIASPAFAYTTAHHRHDYAHRAFYNYRPDAGYRANAAVVPAAGPVDNPVDNPATTGGGSMGYNACAGHPSC
jgi:hypothetical protein